MSRRQMRLSIRLLAAATILAVLAGAGAAWALRGRAEPSGADRLAELFGGPAGLSIVASPDRVEASRLGPPPDRPGVSEADLPTIAGPVPVPDATATTLSRALTSPNSYGWDYAKGCIPSYGVRLSFHRAGGRVDVLLCMQCQMILVSRDGGEGRSEDFDPINAILVDAVILLFPDDPAIQSLKVPGHRARGL
jgi:hypothetical protein